MGAKLTGIQTMLEHSKPTVTIAYLDEMLSYENMVLCIFLGKSLSLLAKQSSFRHFRIDRPNGPQIHESLLYLIDGHFNRYWEGDRRLAGS